MRFTCSQCIHAPHKPTTAHAGRMHNAQQQEQEQRRNAPDQRTNLEQLILGLKTRQLERGLTC